MYGSQFAVSICGQRTFDVCVEQQGLPRKPREFENAAGEKESGCCNAKGKETKSERPAYPTEKQYCQHQNAARKEESECGKKAKAERAPLPTQKQFCKRRRDEQNGKI